MLVSKRYDLGLRILIALAKEPDRYKAARDLAEQENAPEIQVRRILWALAKAGFLSSAIGRKGGYRLAQRPEKVNLYEVLRAIGGEEPVFAVIGRGRQKPAALDRSSPIFPFWQVLEGELRKTLQAQTLADLLR